MGQSKLERAQEKKALQEADAAFQMTRRLKLEADEMEHEQSLRKASEWENRIYNFDAQVNAASVQECCRILGLWVRKDAKEPIEIVFNSPGGSVFEGLAMYDFIQQVREGGTRVDTKATGMAASMGGVLLQAGERRTMSRHSYLLIHEVSSVAGGKTSDIEEEVKFTNRLEKRCLEILSERSDMSERAIKRKWKGKDLWFDAKEALEHGFCDDID